MALKSLHFGNFSELGQQTLYCLPRALSGFLRHFGSVNQKAV